MLQETYSGNHEFIATALAGEVNGYLAHWKRLDAYFATTDVQGNHPVYRVPDQFETEERRLKVIVLCAMYIEALANFYLSLKLDADQFAAIDRIEIVDKWVSIPSLFLPKYSIKRGEGLFDDLRTLAAYRNTLVHMKPKITAESGVVHEGNPPKKMNVHAKILRWDSLPSRLIENLRNYDTSSDFMKFRVLSGITSYENVRKSG